MYMYLYYNKTLITYKYWILIFEQCTYYHCITYMAIYHYNIVCYEIKFDKFSTIWGILCLVQRFVNPHYYT